MEREKGIEPSPIAWEAIVLPLNYSRKLKNITALAARARSGSRLCTFRHKRGNVLELTAWRSAEQ